MKHKVKESTLTEDLQYFVDQLHVTDDVVCKQHRLRQISLLAEAAILTIDAQLLRGSNGWKRRSILRSTS
jgi:hypothetical protein